MMKAICVYLGARAGNNPLFSEAAEKTARAIVASQCALVYGGSSMGLMGQVAETVHNLGGKTIGIITEHLIDKEKPPAYLDELLVVSTMHERKRLLQQRANAFVVLPGGLGTLEEVFDTWNAISLGLLDKPMGFLNVAGYFDKLFEFVSASRGCGFLSGTQQMIPQVGEEAQALVSDLIACCERVEGMVV